MQFDIYRSELPNLGLTDIIIAWSGATPRPHWGNKVDTVIAQTGRDATEIYFKRAQLSFPWDGMSTMESGVYCVSLKHPSK